MYVCDARLHKENREVRCVIRVVECRIANEIRFRR